MNLQVLSMRNQRLSYTKRSSKHAVVSLFIFHLFYFDTSTFRVERKRTTLIITHRLSTAQCADRILVMQRGAIVEQGTHEEMMASSKGIYRDMIARQTKSDDNEFNTDDAVKQSDHLSINSTSGLSQRKHRETTEDHNNARGIHVSISIVNHIILCQFYYSIPLITIVITVSYRESLK